MIEIELRTLGQELKQSNQPQRRETTLSGVSGVGYARYSDYERLDPWSAMMEPTQGRSNDTSGVQLKEEDPQVEEFVRWIMDLVAFVLPGSQTKEDEPLLAMLELSMVIDKAAELLRNDSLDNIMKRTKVYQSVLNLVGKIGAHQVLLRLVQDGRFSKTRSSGLQNISFAMDSTGATQTPQQLLVLASDNKDQSLAKGLENLAIQSEFILGLPDSDPALKRMCQQISSVHMSIMKKEEPIQGTKLPKKQWSNFHKANSVTFNDAILADFLTPLQVEAGKIERQLQYDRTVTDRNKRILSECANMRTSLDDGTFVIVAESRPDMMRALIVGPEDTPYANGLFE